MTKNELAIDLNAILILIISGILLSAFGVELFLKEVPCPLCLLQRMGMIGVTVGAMLNVLYGIRPSHYAISLLSCIVGGIVALRQISLHVCPGTPHFGIPVLGLSLYTWSFIAFACAVFYISILLFLYEPSAELPRKQKLNLISLMACVLIFLITLTNMILTFIRCGMGPCND
jgi:disulfide bond formation protein DsbB